MHSFENLHPNGVYLRAMTARVHLDHAASAPLRPVAREALARHFDLVGNPSALHASGRAARAVLEDAREELAAAVGAQPGEVVFTSGGSESNSIALAAGARRENRPGLLVGATEHPSVDGARAAHGAQLVGVDEIGRVRPAALAASIGPTTGLVSVQLVNNETGLVQSLPELVEIAHGAGAWFHTDAVQALGHIGVDFGELGVEFASLSAHKVGGPVGIGALLVRRGIEPAPYGLGGAQEHQLRSGTQPAMLAAAFAAAATEAVADLEAEAARLHRVREELVRRLRTDVQGVRVNGGEQVSPAICHVTFEGLRADDLLLLLDQAGFDCSTGSACRAGVHQPSETVLAMGGSLDEALGSLRFSFGPGTTPAEVDRLVEALPELVSRARIAHAG